MSSAPIVILAFAGTVAVLIVRSLAVDEIKGRIQRRIIASLDATISSLPEKVQAEWSEEWRADLAQVISMPLTASQFVRGVRRSALEFASDPALVHASSDTGVPARVSRRTGWRVRTPRLQLRLAIAQFSLRLHRRFIMEWHWLDRAALLIAIAGAGAASTQLIGPVLVGVLMTLAGLGEITRAWYHRSSRS